jgi:hypothetical protein
MGEKNIRVGDNRVYRDYHLVNEMEVLDQVIVVGSFLYC